MKNIRSKHKKLSAQLPQCSSHNDSLVLTPSIFRLSPIQSRSRQLSNEDPQEKKLIQRFKFKFSEFESPMKMIQDSNSARKRIEEAKKTSFRAQLREKIKETFPEPKIKESSSTNTGSNPVITCDNSLVNFESIDETLVKEAEKTGNAGIVSLILEQSGLAGNDKKLRKGLIKKMMKTVWTDWFVVGLSSNLDGFGLYGRSPNCFVKIDGTEGFPEQILYSQITRGFKYDWINRRFKDYKFTWDSDAVVYKSN